MEKEMDARAERRRARMRKQLRKQHRMIVALGIATCCLAASTVILIAKDARAAQIDETGAKQAFSIKAECLPVRDESPEKEASEPEYRKDVPLDDETQRLLYEAAEESGIPYELAMAVVWQETDFRNIVGDGGDSIGYMQIQPKWHRERMERLGVSDLIDPAGNFRVGCDFLRELLDRYDGDVAAALVAYNQGSYKGTVTEYASAVLDHMAELKE